MTSRLRNPYLVRRWRTKLGWPARCGLMGREQWERDIWSMFENKTLDKYSSVINMVVRRGIAGMHAAELSQARRDIATSKAQASTPICSSFWNCVLSHYQKKKRKKKLNIYTVKSNN